jgi:hypothetical protein
MCAVRAESMRFVGSYSNEDAGNSGYMVSNGLMMGNQKCEGMWKEPK